jgi:hypothetical protein
MRHKDEGGSTANVRFGSMLLKKGFRTLTCRDRAVRSIAARTQEDRNALHLKTHHRFERMRLRGISGARDEFHLAAIVQNLKRIATLM